MTNSCICQQRVREYLEKVAPGMGHKEDPLKDLLWSHERQREMVAADGDRMRRSNQRLRFLPQRLRRWILGL